MIYIYNLTHPVTGEVRYVGQTNNVKRRYWQHLSALSNSQTHVTRWINSLKASNLFPSINILQVCSDTDWEDAERFWIDTYKLCGASLTNLTAGGKGVGRIPRSTQERTNRVLAKIAVHKHKGNSTSIYYGVSYAKGSKKFKAWVRYQGKVIHIGLFATELDAAIIHDIFESCFYGKDAVLNFPQHTIE